MVRGSEIVVHTSEQTKKNESGAALRDAAFLAGFGSWLGSRLRVRDRLVLRTSSYRVE